ncbi:MAG: helix-turn-helix domain-containing protein [DPANN group archaeon]|nr:helix-turn-helix domain-containing protein [DPANN group archaeon]
MAHLIKEINGKFFTKKVKLESEPEKLKGLLNESRWNILKLLAEKPRYPAEIAKMLGLHEQKVYYHIKQLELNGLIEIKSKQERGGVLAKYYTITNSAFALELPYGDVKVADFSLKTQSDKLKMFLYPFVNAGNLNGNIVVGSPDPHGQNQVRARDGHYGIDIGIFLGQFVNMPKEFTTKLDIDIKAENGYSSNLILIGGPLTNIIVSEINNYLPVKFKLDLFPYRGLISEKTKKNYDEDSIGIIAKIINPMDKDKSILLIAGNRFNGTKAAVLALTRHTEQVLDKYNGEDNWTCVVSGLDMDGDGKIDNIKILE